MDKIVLLFVMTLSFQYLTQMEAAKQSSSLIQEYETENKNETRQGWILDQLDRQQILHLLKERRGNCYPSCQDDEVCRKTYTCHNKNSAPPTGSLCKPGVYENYCCDVAGYVDNDLVYKVVPIGGDCVNGQGDAGVCTKDDEIDLAYCDKLRQKN